MSVRPLPETVAAWALDAIRPAGCPAPAIVDAIIAGASPGRPGPITPLVRPALYEATARGFAIRHDDGSWEPTALGVLVSWASRAGFFSGA